MKKVLKKVLGRTYNGLVVPYHHLKGFMSANHYDYPASAMTVIGVTGTNGKTSTCCMIYNTLLQAGLKAAMITTVKTSIFGEDEAQLGHMTTADTRLVNKKIAQMRDKGVQYLVLEVSSHALSQGRVFGIPIDIAVMTNVAPEHLDYHRTFERYRQAKVKLFTMLADNAKRGGRGVGIINADDPSARYFAAVTPQVTSYGIAKGDIRATRVQSTTKGVDYYTRIDKQAYHIKVNIPGEIYVYNSLAAVAACHALGIEKADIEQGIASLAGVDGRMERIENELGFDVIVDYAHTPDAYEKILPDIRKATKGKLIIVSGAAGERDNSKFAKMGELAAESADLLILTEEDAGPVEVRKLSELVAKGARKAGMVEDDNLLFINNRHDALEKALHSARKGDTVLLLGMGHEKQIDRANGPEPWNDAAAAREIMTDMLTESSLDAKDKKTDKNC
ncbi:MAG: UDP-N-acetylmuramoyl-L-alanyl-D-glutamate--2,6-diaminopimelate ligase [Candidatus Saccharibacteria bacterium]|nr:UDP-N-acetylmuramoyl-L-alanyl-D-glutamate--2,6-diaminopimelate ligase [Candidatus Saccharibacteria bacterium]